jgi:hypothetical protein
VWRPVGEPTGDPEIDGGYAVDSEGRARRREVEAEALAVIRQEAARAAAEAQARLDDEKAGSPDPIEFLVKLPTILFAIAVVVALLVILLRGGE